jgi:hypothetical protein
MADYSENKPIWPGSSSFTAGDTPFGFFDSDTMFQSQADSFASFAAQNVGYPIMDVELIDKNFYTAFESAVIEYSNQVNQVNITNNLLSTLGIQTGSDFLVSESFSDTLVGGSLSYITKLSKTYGAEAGSGGNEKWYTAKVKSVPGQQNYNIKTAISESGLPLSSTSSIEIKQVLHHVPPAIIRYFDPFVGTGLGTQNLLDAFDFGGFSPSVNFMMMPLHQDLLRIQTIEFNDRIRKSHWSFEIHGDDIKIFPIPSASGSISDLHFDEFYVYYTYEEKKANESVLFGNTAAMSGVVSDASNIPYTYQKYSQINDMGRAWIIKYGLALVKEMLGYVRGKYSTVPIPNSEVTLNGSELVTQGQSEKDALITQLREFLEKMTKESMVTRQQAENDAMNEVLSRIPTKIYVG